MALECARINYNKVLYVMLGIPKFMAFNDCLTEMSLSEIPFTS